MECNNTFKCSRGSHLVTQFLIASRGLHVDTSFLQAVGPTVRHVSILIRSMRLQVGNKHSGSSHSSPDVQSDSVNIARHCIERSIFVKISGRQTIKPVKNTLLRGQQLMASVSLRDFMAQQLLNARDADETDASDDPGQETDGGPPVADQVEDEDVNGRTDFIDIELPYT